MDKQLPSDIDDGKGAFRILVNPVYDAFSNESPIVPSCSEIDEFKKNGYAVFPQVFTKDSVMALNHQLELVLRGQYNTGSCPDKTPKLIKTPLHQCGSSSESITSVAPVEEDAKYALGYSGNKRKKVLQIINIHKSNTLFRDLVTTSVLGRLVAKLMQWEDGARLCQDQIWAKPPGAPPLAYHRDSPYFMFDPNPVATVWIALDDMTPDLGPLTYVKGSHLWGEGRVGSSQNFFQDDGGMSLLYSAARRAGLGEGNTDDELNESLEFKSMSGLLAGGISIHDGRTWHGSSGNISDLPRRGIGLHFVRKDVMWTEDAVKSNLWRKYVKDVIDRGDSVNEIKLDEQDFPVTWTPEMDK